MRSDAFGENTLKQKKTQLIQKPAGHNNYIPNYNFSLFYIEFVQYACFHSIFLLLNVVHLHQPLTRRPT